MYQYLVCINVRPENVADFTKISARIARLAPEIGVLGRPGDYHESMIPPELVHLPRLTIYLVNPPSVPNSRGHTLAVAKLSKHWQHENFLRNGIAVPESMPFEFGTKVDRKIFGNIVVLKPVEGSSGRGIFLLQSDQLESLMQEDIPHNHPLKTLPYFLQRFIATENGRTIYRTLIFLGEPIMMFRATGGDSPSPSSDVLQNLQTEIFAGAHVPNPKRRRELVKNYEILEFAKKVYAVHPDKPLQGIDTLKEADTGNFYVLECNSGGNVWSFSNPNAAPLHQQYGVDGLVEQFKAWVVSADVLIRKTRELAC